MEYNPKEHRHEKSSHDGATEFGRDGVFLFYYFFFDLKETVHFLLVSMFFLVPPYKVMINKTERYVSIVIE
jgi:hypothetical protein